MSIRTALVIVLAILCGSAAAVGIRQLNAGARDRGTAVESDNVSIVVAKERIGRGEVVSASKLETREYPKGILPESALTSISNCVGCTSSVPIEAGEPILAGKLLSGEDRGGLAALIPPGMRAYTIATSGDKTRVAGFVMPGNRVDVLLMLRGGDAQLSGGGSTVTLLQAVEILAVAQETAARADQNIAPKEMKSVTLLVTPDQVALLDLGQNIGQLSLSLRNPNDLMAATPAPATLNMLQMLQMGPVVADESGTEAPVVSEIQNNRQDNEQFTIRTMRGRHGGYVMIRPSNRQ